MRLVELSDLYRLRSAGLVDAASFPDAVSRVRDDAFWTVWAHRALLAIGVAHVLAGIVFFFAYNWADLPPMAKFAIVEVALVLTASGALIAGIGTLPGQALLVAASVLVGVLLAVVGQAYQTGADAFELFVAWTLLVLPWTLFSRSAAQWFTWLAVAYVAAWTYCVQVLIPMKWLDDGNMMLLVGALPAVALILREAAVRLGFEWMAAIWTRYLLLFAAMGHFFVAASAYVLKFHGHDPAWSLAVFGVALAVGLWFYRLVRPDFPAFSLLVAYGGFFLMVAGGRVIFEGFDREVVAGFALMTLWCVGIAGGMGKLLLALRAGNRGSGA